MNNDLISRSRLKEHAQKLLVGESINTYFGINLYKMFEEIIDNTPVETNKIEHKAYNDGFKDGVDQGIKLSERPQGEWIELRDYDFKCSLCGDSFMDKHNFCPNCGAEMRKGGSE